jgi:predicted DNA-binding transcriptional regulator YafY
LGARSAGQTTAGIMVAFLQERTWRQKTLADHLGIESRALVRRLKELAEGGMPLEREEEAPDVFWSVPHSWFPKGVLLQGERLQQLVRLVSRLRQSAERDKALELLLGGETTDEANAEPALVDDAVLHAVQEACRHRRALVIHYRSAHSAETKERVVSPAALRRLDERPQMYAWCHFTGEARVFRLDAIEAVQLAGVNYRETPAVEVERWRAHSVEGFIASGPLVDCWFEVKSPEGRWVTRNLPEGTHFEVQEREGVLCHSCTTGALVPLARFVAGLGELLVGCSPELADHVGALASAAALAVCPQSGARSRHDG